MYWLADEGAGQRYWEGGRRSTFADRRGYGISTGGGIDGTKGGVDGRLSRIVISMVLVPRELKYVINFTTNKKPLKLDF